MSAALIAPPSPRARPHLDVLADPRPNVTVAAALVLIGAVGVGASAVLSPVAPVVVAVALVLGLAAYQRPVIAAVLVVAACPAISGVQRGSGLGPLKASELLLLLATVALVLRRPEAGERLRAADWSLLALAVLGAGLAAAHTINGDSSNVSFVRIGLQPTLLFLTWWTASRAVRDEADLRTVLRWALGASTIPAALAVLQAFDAPVVRGLLVSLTQGASVARPGAAGVARATGPFPLWHSLAAYLLPAIAVTVVLLLRRDRRVLPTTALGVVLAVDVAALVLTVTVTVVVWAALAVLLVAAMQRRLAPAVVLLAVVAAVSAALFAGPITHRLALQTASSSATSHSVVPQTVAYRLEVWRRDYVPLLEPALPWGVGNDLPESVLFQHAENQYLTLLLRGGIALLVAVLMVWVAIGVRLARVARRGSELGGVVAGALLAVLVFLPLTSMAWPYLTNAGFPQAWLSLAGAASAAGLARKRSQRARVES
jgi:O-antigen ligase